MMKKAIVIMTCIFISVLSSACGPTIQTLEVTRIMPQTVIATRLVTQVVQVIITATPQPTGIFTPTLTPSPRWTPSFTETPLRILPSPTPGLQMIDNIIRPEVEKFVSAQYIRDYLVLNYGHQRVGGKNFCGYTPMGISNDGNTLKLYVWAECAEYFLKDQEIKIGFGLDIPVVLFVELRNGTYKIVNFLDAGGGFRFVQTNFPPEIQKIILDLNNAPKSFTNEMGKVHQELRNEADIFFKK